MSLSNALWVEVLSLSPPNGLFKQVLLRTISLCCLFHGFMEALFAHLEQMCWVPEVLKNLPMWAFMMLYSSNNSFKGT